MSVHQVCAVHEEARRRHWIYWNGAIDSCGQLYRFWEWKLGTPTEQPELGC